MTQAVCSGGWEHTTRTTPGVDSVTVLVFLTYDVIPRRLELEKSTAADVYLFGGLMFEVMFRREPFSWNTQVRSRKASLANGIDVRV